VVPPRRLSYTGSGPHDRIPDGNFEEEPLGRRRRLLERILGGRSDANIPFEQTRTLLLSLGFNERTSGSHHIFWREGLARRINLQPTREGTCKPYQVRQMRETLLEYREELRI
jgi:hypothetical protein